MKKMFSLLVLVLISIGTYGHSYASMAKASAENVIDPEALVYEQNITADDGKGTAVFPWVSIKSNLAMKAFAFDVRVLEFDVVTDPKNHQGLRILTFDGDTMIQKTLTKDSTMELQLALTPLADIENYKDEIPGDFLLQCIKDGYCLGFNARLVKKNTPLPLVKDINSTTYPKLKFFTYMQCEIPAVIKFMPLKKAPGTSEILASIDDLNGKITDRGQYALIFNQGDTLYEAITKKHQTDVAVLLVLPMSDAEILGYRMYADTLAARNARALVEFAAEIAQDQADRAAQYDTILRKEMTGKEKKQWKADEEKRQTDEAQELEDAKNEAAQEDSAAYALADYMAKLQKGPESKDPKPRYRIFAWEVKPPAKASASKPSFSNDAENNNNQATTSKDDLPQPKKNTPATTGGDGFAHPPKQP